MAFRVSLTAVCLALAGFRAAAEEWTTADGRLAVTVPTTDRFSEIAPPPPLVVTWVSHDQSTRLAVMAAPLPGGAELLQRSLEEGLAEEVGGPIVDSSAEDLSGRRVYRMTARAGDGVTHVAQSVVAIDGTVYKVMAVTSGVPPADDPDAAAFLASLRTVPPAAIPQTNAPGSQSTGPPVSKTFGLHDLSKKLGSLAAMLLLVVAVALWLRRRRARKPGGSPTAH